MTNKKNSDRKDAEYGVDSRYASAWEKKSESVALMAARLDRMRNLSREQVVRAKLLQLKLRMEQFLREPVYDNERHFSSFLQTYVDTIYPQRNRFARDIHVTPVFLSQVINNHREPNEEFIMKLMIHSELVYDKVCDFEKKTWFEVFLHEKLCETMFNQDEWRPAIEKLVTLSEPVL